MTGPDGDGRQHATPRDGDEVPEFGPSGYLPERASKRARKIVLRAPLGMQWVWAAIVAGAVVLLAGVVFLSRADDAPGGPYQAVDPLAEIENGEVRSIGGETLLLVTEGGRPRAFDVSDLEEPPIFCPESRRLEAAGRAWSLTGRGLGGPSLPEFPTLVSRGVVYIDLTRTDAVPPTADPVPSTSCTA